MNIAIVTLDGFNEMDSLVAMTMFNRLRAKGWNAQIVAPTTQITSMNGVAMEAQQPLSFAHMADGVILGSGIKTNHWKNQRSFFESLVLEPSRQLIGAQCSGRQLLCGLGLGDQDLPMTMGDMESPLAVSGNLAWAGGCLAAQYLVAWMILRLGSKDMLEDVVHSVAPYGEENSYTSRMCLEVLGADPSLEQCLRIREAAASHG